MTYPYHAPKIASRETNKHIPETFENYNFKNNNFNFHFNQEHVKILNLV